MHSPSVGDRLLLLLLLWLLLLLFLLHGEQKGGVGAARRVRWLYGCWVGKFKQEQ